jgi:hypothetical protein
MSTTQDILITWPDGSKTYGDSSMPFAELQQDFVGGGDASFFLWEFNGNSIRLADDAAVQRAVRKHRAAQEATAAPGFQSIDDLCMTAVVMGPKPVATDQLGQKLKRRSTQIGAETQAKSVAETMAMPCLPKKPKKRRGAAGTPSAANFFVKIPAKDAAEKKKAAHVAGLQEVAAKKAAAEAAAQKVAAAARKQNQARRVLGEQWGMAYPFKIRQYSRGAPTHGRIWTEKLEKYLVTTADAATLVELGDGTVGFGGDLPAVPPLEPPPTFVAATYNDTAPAALERYRRVQEAQQQPPKAKEKATRGRLPASVKMVYRDFVERHAAHN